MKLTPTSEGIKRYNSPPKGYYTANGEKIPCTCTKKCKTPCKGACGCLACLEAYQDFMSLE